MVLRKLGLGESFQKAASDPKSKLGAELKFIDYSIYLLIFSFVYSFVSLRPLMSESSQWFYGILLSHNFVGDGLFYRISGRALQAPAILVLHLTFLKNFINLNRLALYTLCFCHTFHPLLSLSFARSILKKNDRLDLLIFPVISLVAATLPALPYAVAQALPALSLFWPLFFLVLFKKGSSPLTFCLILVLVFALAFSYEPVILFFLLLIVVNAYEVRREKLSRGQVWENFTIIASCGLAIVWLMSVVLKAPPKASGAFLSSLWAPYGAFTIYGFMAMLLVAFPLCLPFWSGRSAILKYFVLISFFILSFWICLKLFLIVGIPDDSTLNVPFSWQARATGMIVAFILGILCILIKYLKPDSSWLWNKRNILIVYLTSAVILTSALCDARVTYEWKKGFSFFKAYLSAQSSGIACINYNLYSEKMGSKGISLEGTAELSVLVQVLNDIDPVRSILFVADDKSPNGIAPLPSSCYRYVGRDYLAGAKEMIYLRSPNIKFSPEILHAD